MKYLAAAALVLGACTTESHDIDFVVGYDDAPYTPTYIAYRDGGGAWQTPERTANGRYALRVTDTYQVVYVCTDDNGLFDVEEVRATVDDGATYAALPYRVLESGGCKEPSWPTTPLPFQVTGRTAQASDLVIGGISMSTSTFEPTFSTPVPSGTYPLFATDHVDPGKRVLKRMIDVTADLDLGTIDLASDALPTEPRTITVRGAEGPGSWFANGPQGITLAMDTGVSGIVTLPRLAASQRDPDDNYWGTFVAASEKSMQTYTTTHADRATAIDLIAPPAVTFSDAPFAATWTPDDTSYASLEYQLGGGGATRVARATPRWLAETGTTTLAFADDLPEFPATWTLNTTATYFLSLTLEQWDDIATTAARVER